MNTEQKNTTQPLPPEEQVRQWFIGELVAMGVDRQRIAVEYSIIVGGRRLRIDLAIFASGSTTISAIVECKAPTVTLSSAALQQAAAYNSALGAHYIIVTNGHHTYIYDTHLKRFTDKLPCNL